MVGWLALDPRPAPDADLVRRLRAGDEDAFAELVRAQAGPLLSTARRILRNEEDARDAVQEAFLSAHRSLSTYKGNSRVTTWLHRILVNACLMKLRARRRRPEEPIDGLLPAFDETGHRTGASGPWSLAPEESLQRKELAVLVRSLVDRLPDSYRTVLLLREIEELDTAETARLLDLTENAVKIRLHRARQALRTLLDPHVTGGAE